jgi:hypothetical protein
MDMKQSNKNESRRAERFEAETLDKGKTGKKVLKKIVKVEIGGRLLM